MIIKAISANNFLKYEDLQLSDLPEHGVIGVRGNNESGKSSIGELICYALFGQTFANNEGEGAKLISWGEGEGSVKVTFTAGGDTTYEVSRVVDMDGNYAARLDRAGDDEPLARGCEAVTDAVAELVGFGFDEFIETFYLAQREIISPHPQSAALKSIAGLAVLEQLEDDFQEEITAERNAADQARRDSDRIEREIQDLGVREDELGDLERQAEGLRKERAERENASNALSSAMRAYREASERASAVAGQKGVAGFLSFLSLVLAVVSGGVWYLLEKMPAHPVGQKITAAVPQAQPMWFLIGAAVLAALFLIFWMRSATLKKHAGAAAAPAKELAEKLESTHRRFPPEGATDEGANDDAAAGAEAAPAAEQINALTRRLKEFQPDPAEVEKTVDQEAERVRAAAEEKSARIDQLDEAIGAERAKREQAEALQTRGRELQQKADAREDERAHRELAIELLQGSERHMLHRFNAELRNMVATLLPLFTENRYEHLQITEDLSVRVFSNKKRDYMELSEISAGTQRQIMLALRLALAEQLHALAVPGKQFLFLDEPFAFFDEDRTRETLKVFGDFHEDITQVFVVAQHFPAGSEFALDIECDGDEDKLVVGETPPPPAPTEPAAADE